MALTIKWGSSKLTFMTWS